MTSGSQGQSVQRSSGCGSQPAAMRSSASAISETGTFCVLHSTTAPRSSSGDQAMCEETPGRLPPWRYTVRSRMKPTLSP